MTAIPIPGHVTDDVGLDGRLLYGSHERNFTRELYSYPADLGLLTIKDAWLAKYPRGRFATAVIQERVESGRRLIRVDRFTQEADRRPSLEEPPV